MKLRKTEHKKMSLNNKRAFFIFADTILLALVVIGLSYFALRGRDTMKIDHDVYIVVNGTKLYYHDGVTLKHDDNGTILTNGKKKENIQDRVLIDPVTHSITLQKSGSYNRTDDNNVTRIDYFTQVVEENGKVTLKRGNKHSDNVSGVIYDNKDTFIFLEPAELVYGDVKRQIQPMTVVEVEYMSYIQIFTPDGKEEFSYLDAETVMATFKNGKRVNLATDRFYQKDGSWRLMYLPLDVLKSWK